MKKFLKFLLICIFIFISVFIIKVYFYKDYGGISLQMKNENLDYKVKYKGLKNSVDFTMDDKENYYIAYRDKIQIIKNNGESYDILKDNNLNIYSIDYENNNLYYSSGSKIYSYDLKNNKSTELMKDIPNHGDYEDSIIKIRGEYLYISIGAATNSGVVGEDNKWIKDNFYAHDVTPKNITLKGLNFGVDKTGAFQSYKTKSIKGQIIPEHFPGNSSIIIYNLKTGNSETFAWGIRNVTGMDFTNESKLLCAVGGMEDRGSRAVSGDTDYIYEIKKGIWYGWPDYSGGDPVTSPKFKSNKGISLQFILENHPTTNPPAPLYQHKNVGAIGSLAVDRNGVLGEKNCIFFYDKLNNVIYGFNGAGSEKEEVKFNKQAKISVIKIYNKSLYVLDEKEGYLYSIEKGKINNSLKIDKNIYAYLLLTAVLGILLVLKIQKD